MVFNMDKWLRQAGDLNWGLMFPMITEYSLVLPENYACFPGFENAIF